VCIIRVNESIFYRGAYQKSKITREQQPPSPNHPLPFAMPLGKLKFTLLIGISKPTNSKNAHTSFRAFTQKISARFK